MNSRFPWVSFNSSLSSFSTSLYSRIPSTYTAIFNQIKFTEVTLVTYIGFKYAILWYRLPFLSSLPSFITCSCQFFEIFLTTNHITFYNRNQKLKDVDITQINSMVILKVENNTNSVFSVISMVWNFLFKKADWFLNIYYIVAGNRIKFAFFKQKCPRETKQIRIEVLLKCQW